ncbi:hypothetical protein TSPI_08617 [Trichinella spiralis]|uniref:Secreted protein n=1 Tax=Trichinella spiralis TaxID=6334 RepID=A0ABR3KGR2_TRISP
MLELVGVGLVCRIPASRPLLADTALVVCDTTLDSQMCKTTSRCWRDLGNNCCRFGHDDAVSHHRVPCDLLTSRAMKHIQLSSVFVGFEAVQAHT